MRSRYKVGQCKKYFYTIPQYHPSDHLKSQVTLPAPAFRPSLLLKLTYYRTGYWGGFLQRCCANPLFTENCFEYCQCSETVQTVRNVSPEISTSGLLCGQAACLAGQPVPLTLPGAHHTPGSARNQGINIIWSLHGCTRA